MEIRRDCRTVSRIEPGGYYLHFNAKVVGACPEGCCDKYECPDCGTRFTVQLAG